MALTVTEINNTKPKEKAFKLYDEAGLFLQVTPSGGKLWRFKYRYEGKEKLLSLGTYPEVPLADARARREEARKLLAKIPSIDPSANRKAVKAEKSANQSNTFELWASKWWQHWQKDKSPRYVDYVKRRLEADIFPIIGNRPITLITAYEIVDVVKGITARGALDIASKAHQTIGQVFRYAIAHGKDSKVTNNPAIEIKPSDIIESRKKLNYARLDIKEFPSLLRAIDNSKSEPITRLAIKLMALTFVRTSELIGAKWEEIDFDAKQWRIPAERMKMDTPHIVPLASQTIEILKNIQAISGFSKLLFPNRNDHTKSMSNNTILKALDVMGYKYRMTGHGFRGVASTALNELEFPPKIIEIQLSHLVGNATQRAYDHAAHLPQRIAMMQQWANYLDELKVGAKVIPFKTA